MQIHEKELSMKSLSELCLKEVIRTFLNLGGVLALYHYPTDSTFMSLLRASVVELQ
jgi:hypothetical protein